MTVADTIAAKVSIRPARPSDAAFIGSHWVQAQQRLEADDPHTFSRVVGASFHSVQNRIIDRLLSRRDVTTHVACKPDNDDTLFGFATFGSRHLHFLFVRPELRGFGLARELTKGAELLSCSARWPTKARNMTRLIYRPEASW